MEIKKKEPTTRRELTRHGKVFAQRGGNIRDPKFRSVNVEEVNFQGEDIQTGLAAQFALNRIDSGSAFIDMIATGPIGEFTLTGSIIPATDADNGAGTGSVLGSASRAYLNVISENFLNPSDARLKVDVKDLDKGLARVNSIRPVSYKRDKENAPVQHGVIAQELKEVLPEAVAGSEEDMYSVDYARLVPVLVKAVQELSAEVEELKKKMV
jgi:hypothetical protein